MSKQAQLMEVLKKEVRSLLIATKEGLTPAQLEQEYLAMIGKPLPLRDLGFRSTLELVAEMPDVVRICPYKKGTLILKVIADETTKEIAKLVAKQKSAKARKSTAMKADVASPSQNPQSVPRRSRAPVLPGKVKAKLWEPMSSSLVLLSDLAAPAAEMPLLEPSYETESFHLTEEEMSEPVETQAVGLGDGLKQPQDLEQSLLEKLTLTPEIPPDAVQNSSLCRLPPLEARCMVGVFVGFIVSPSQFYIHVCHRETRDELLDMMIRMRHCYSDKCLSDRYVMPQSLVRSGQLCCVLVADWWYRVIIHRVINDQEVEVFYVDYGNLEIVRKSWLRFLKCCYLELPAQAIPCSLARVRPVEDTWPSAATLLFKELCGSDLLVGLLDEYVNGILHLFLCDTSTEEDVYFHRVLSDVGHANICEENIPSQGFMNLNPLALYVRPSGQKENAELVDQDLHLQQESLGAESGTASSRLGGDELCEQQRCLSAKNETQDDAQPLLDERSVPRTTAQDPKLAQEDAKETSTELTAVVETPRSLEESSVPAVSFKLVEDCYLSFSYAKQAAAVRQDGPAQLESFSSELQLPEAMHPAILLMAVPFMLDSHDAKDEKTRDFPGSPAMGLCSAGGPSDQGPAPKLYIPPTMLSAVLASACLATFSGFFQWFPSLRKKV